MPGSKKLVAATLAAARCAALKKYEPEDYLDQYEAFRKLMHDQKVGARPVKVSSVALVDEVRDAKGNGGSKPGVSDAPKPRRGTSRQPGARDQAKSGRVCGNTANTGR
jgi:hypothetical protein